MKQKDKLTLCMSLLFLVVFVTFGVIIVMDKSSSFIIPRVDKKLNNYLKDTYPSIVNDVETSKTTYKNAKYNMKVSDKKNKNLFFTITYSNRKITDTYKKDYIKGTTFINYLNNQISKNIKIKTYKNCTVELNNTLDNYSSKVRQLLYNEKNLETLSIYTIKDELVTDSWKTLNIQKTIRDYNSKMKLKNINPKSYTLTINDKEDVTNSVVITNLTREIIEKNELTNVINDIITKKKSNTDRLNITYKYLN